MDLSFLLFGAILWSSVAISAVAERSGNMKNRHRCGIRKREDFPSKNNEPVEPGQWPWNAFVYYKEVLSYAGSLIDQQHVLTSASSVTEWDKEEYALQDSSRLSILLGVNEIYNSVDQIPNHLRVTNVSQIIVHPEYKRGHHDIALLVLSKPIRYSEYVIPICITGIQRNQDKELIGQVGATIDVNSTPYSYTCTMLVENTTKCAENGSLQFGTFCASFQNCTEYIFYGAGLNNFIDNHWVIRGITVPDSEALHDVNDIYYKTIINVTYYNEWIRNETGFNHQISETKCHQYSKITRKYSNGQCINKRNEHHLVVVIGRNEHIIGMGSIISENFVLTKIPNLIDSDFEWDDLWIENPRTKITDMIFHPKYDPETLRYDVMLLELASPLTLSSHLIPNCLANEVHQHLDKLLLYYYFDSSNYEIISNEQCKSIAKQYHRKFNVFSEDICVALSDSYNIVGFPLHAFNERSCMFTQIGVFKGLKIMLNGELGEWDKILVFSPVTAYLDWIEQVVWGSNEDFFKDKESDEPTKVDDDD